MNKKQSLLALALLTLLNSTFLIAETTYVNDRLFLGVYAEPSSEQSAIHTLSSGSAVEILEKTEMFTKVRSDTGVEGWVSARFISVEKPASVKVKELEDERNRLSAELKKAPSSKELESIKLQLKDANIKINVLESKSNTQPTPVDTQEIDTLKAQLQTAQNKVVELEKKLSILSTSEEVIDQPNGKISRPAALSAVSWHWLLLGILLLFLSGFVFGASMLAQRVRKRFNGIKVW